MTRRWTTFRVQYDWVLGERGLVVGGAYDDLLRSIADHPYWFEHPVTFDVVKVRGRSYNGILVRR